jgi:DNA-binding PadR family transcriptional regulator
MIAMIEAPLGTAPMALTRGADRRAAGRRATRRRAIRVAAITRWADREESIARFVLTRQSDLCRLAYMGAQQPHTRLTHQSLKVLRVFLDCLGTEVSGAELMRTTGLPSGTIYPILLRFEQQEILASRWEQAAPQELKRPRRRLYSMTSQGAALARTAFNELLLPLWKLQPRTV